MNTKKNLFVVKRHSPQAGSVNPVHPSPETSDPADRWITEHLSYPKVGELKIARFEDFEAVVDAFLDEHAEKESIAYWPLYGHLWAASRAMAQFLAERKLVPARSRVLEVGCGLALPSILLAKMGATVEVCDFHPQVPKVLAQNLAQNSLDPSSVLFRSLDWTRYEPSSIPSPKFDLILGSDILYEPSPPKGLVHLIEDLLSPEGRFVLSDIGRVYYQRFLSMMEDQGFEAHERLELEVEDPPNNSKNQRVFITVFGRE